MDTSNIQLSRISKLFVDRDAMSVNEALARRQSFSVILVGGSDVAQSYTLQLAILTAANIASRCFPGAVRVALDEGLADAPLLLWPSLHWTLGGALVQLLGAGALAGMRSGPQDAHSIVFGNAMAPRDALRVTFDGWIAAVGPVRDFERLPEREYCSLSGILAAALAISELFLSFADLSIEAGRRTVALSLWRPDVDVHDPSALGVPVEFLPGDLWVLGLGHLGNAYLWALATLPYRDPADVEIFLNDFDKVEAENVDTGLIFNLNDVDRLKTRACAAWLEERGFKTRLIERAFGSDFRCHHDGQRDEPRLALCGFDTNPARRHLASAEFVRVFESGLGGTATNFDTIRFHSLPNPRTPTELWPDPSVVEIAKELKHRERAVLENAAYARLNDDECGRIELAGKSVAVPFVGAAAACFVVAEAIRLLHGGPAYTDFKLGMGTPNGRAGRTAGDYSANDLAGLKHCEAAVP